ncbi:hypothetical protein BKA93DRAFT_866003 [Sparassis latifolia]
MAGKARWSKPYGSMMVLYYPKWRDSKCGARAAVVKKVSEAITARANAKGWDRPKVNTQQIGNWFTNNKAALDLGIIPGMTDRKFSLADAERMAKDDNYPDLTEGEGGADPATVDDDDVEPFSVEEDAADVRKKMMGQKWVGQEHPDTKDQVEKLVWYTKAFVDKWHDLTDEERDELKVLAAKKTEESQMDRAEQTAYAQKHLGRMGEDFIQTVETKMGGKVLILLALPTEKPTQIRCTKLQSPDTGGFLKFTDSVDDWQKDLWKKWGMWAMNVMIPDELKDNDAKEEDEIALIDVQHEIDDDGNAIVPAFEEMWKLTQKRHLVQAIVTHQHRKIVDSKHAKCPWKKISEDVRKYIDEACWPDSVVFAEPWNISVDNIDLLLKHWANRQAIGSVAFQFLVAAGGGDAVKPRGKKQKDVTDMNVGNSADKGDQDDNDNEVEVGVNRHTKGKGKQPAMRKKHVPPHSEEEFDLDNVSSGEDDSVGVKMKAAMNKAKSMHTANTAYDEEGWQPFSAQDLVDVPRTGDASSSGVAGAPAAIAHARKLYPRIANHPEDIILWPRLMMVDADWYKHDVSRIVIPPPAFSLPDPAENDAAELEWVDCQKVILLTTSAQFQGFRILDLEHIVQRPSMARLDNPRCFAPQLLADDTAAIPEEYVKVWKYEPEVWQAIEHPLREQWTLAGTWVGGLPLIAPSYKVFLQWNSSLINNPEDGSPASATRRSEFLLSLSIFKEYRLLVKVCRLTPRCTWASWELAHRELPSDFCMPKGIETFCAYIEARPYQGFEMLTSALELSLMTLAIGLVLRFIAEHNDPQTVALGLDDTLMLQLRRLCWLFARQIRAYTKTAYAEGGLTADEFSAYSVMTGLVEEPVIVEHRMLIKTTSAPADSQAATADSTAVQPQASSQLQHRRAQPTPPPVEFLANSDDELAPQERPKTRQRQYRQQAPPVVAREPPEEDQLQEEPARSAGKKRTRAQAKDGGTAPSTSSAVVPHRTGRVTVATRKAQAAAAGRLPATFFSLALSLPLSPASQCLQEVKSRKSKRHHSSIEDVDLVEVRASRGRKWVMRAVQDTPKSSPGTGRRKGTAVEGPSWTSAVPSESHIIGDDGLDLFAPESLSTRTHSGKSQQNLMRSWLLYQAEYLSEILGMEAPPEDQSVCQNFSGFNGVRPSPGAWRKYGWEDVINLGGDLGPQLEDEGQVHFLGEDVVDDRQEGEVVIASCNGVYVQKMLRMALYPASQLRPRTVFTFNVLKYFSIDVIVCNTSASRFYTKMRRLTHNAAPQTVPFGNGLASAMIFLRAQVVGSSLIFVRLALNHVLIYLRIGKKILKLADGNFTLEHMKMRRPENDVPLTNGQGFMVDDVEYHDHLKCSKETIERPQVLEHVSVLAMGVSYPIQWLTSKKKEVLLYNTEGLQFMDVCYDVACQWWIHFLECIADSKYLKVTDKIKIIAYVGKFHLGAHIAECFAKFSLNFGKDMDEIEGEVVEMLWSKMNGTGPSTRAMTKAHRREVLDDHFRDWNWMKLLGIVNMLRTKYSKAVKGESEMEQEFVDLSTTMTEDDIKVWTEQETAAMRERGDKLNVYNVNLEKAPSMGDIHLLLATEERQSPNEEDRVLESGTVTWLSTGINIEKTHLCFRDDIQVMAKHLTKRSSTTDKNSVETKRNLLQKRIDGFHNRAMALLDGEDIEHLEISSNEVANEEGWTMEDVEENPEDIEEEVLPENITLLLSSSLGIEQCKTVGWESIAQQELQLRVGQANDCLEDLHNKSQWHKTRNAAELRKIGQQERKIIRRYKHARKALICLGASEQLLTQYLDIQKEDTKMPGDIVEENRVGQRNDRLTWFWKLGGENARNARGESVDNNTEDVGRNAMKEDGNYHARYTRYKEEVPKMRHEMLWTVLWFEHKQHEWQTREMEAVNAGLRGHASYAAKQGAMWKDFALQSQQAFNGQMIVR